MDTASTEPVLRFKVTAIRYTINSPHDKQSIEANSSQDKEEMLMPPEAVRYAAKRGIDLYEKYGGVEDFRIPRLLAQATPISIKDIYQILDFFETHEFDTREPGWGDQDEPSVDWIRWLMMGSDRAWTWARIVKRLRTAVIVFPQ
jgi:hypothetical protein